MTSSPLPALYVDLLAVLRDHGWVITTAACRRRCEVEGSRGGNVIRAAWCPAGGGWRLREASITVAGLRHLSGPQRLIRLAARSDTVLLAAAR